jgi:threonine synthase
MTAAASTIRCHGCGYVADPADPYPFRCPRAGTDDADHVLARVLTLDGAAFPRDREANPFVRYRALMHSYHVATARGLGDDTYRDLVASLDASVAAVDGRGFRATPFFRSGDLSDALGFDRRGGVWVKDETGNVSGSHKGRHLMGVLIHLAVMEHAGLLDPARRRELAIASSTIQALREAAALGALTRLPRIHTVQTTGTHPLERAYARVRAPLPGGAGPDAIGKVLAEAAAHRSSFMRP